MMPDHRPRDPRDAIGWHQLAGSRLSKTLSVRQWIRNHMDAVALMDKTPPCSSIQPDPESGPVGHPFVQDPVKRGTATALEADATSGWKSFRSCNPHIAPLKVFAIIGGGFSLPRRTRRKARESFSFCQRSVLPSADRLDRRRQPLHKNCCWPTCQLTDGELMRQCKPSRAARTFRPEWIGGATPGGTETSYQTVVAQTIRARIK